LTAPSFGASEASTDEALSNFAFNLKLRHYTVVVNSMGAFRKDLTYGEDLQG
jgi:hypothetical protein